MFDAFFKIMTAYNALMLLLGGVVCLGIGGLLLGNAAMWRLHGRRVTAKVTGVLAESRRKEAMYYPVFTYTLDGVERRTESTGGSSSLTDKIPGTRVSIFVRPDKPDDCYVPSTALLAFGVVFSVPGIFLCWQAVKMFEGGLVTWLVALGLIGFLGMKIARLIKPRTEWETKSTFIARKQAERQQKRASMSLLSEDEVARLLQRQRKTSVAWIPVVLLLGGSLIAGGGYMWNRTGALLHSGVRAEGEVTSLEASRGANSTSYYPHIAFVGQDGARHSFKDGIGSNPPLYKVGEKLHVIYDPTHPDRAMVDRGIWNRLIPWGLIAGGLGIIAAFFRHVVMLRRRKTPGLTP